MRRGLGLVYLLSGLIYTAQMVFATLYALGHLPGILIGKGVWSQLYFAHFLFTVLAGMGYLGLDFLKRGVFEAQALVDFLIGLAAFIILFSFTGLFLVRGWANPWGSLTPGVFLLYYAWRLLSGKALLRRFDIRDRC